MNEEMLTPEQQAEFHARQRLEKESFERACEWDRRAVQVGAGDGFLNVVFYNGEILMMESDAIPDAEATGEMISRLIVDLSKFFRVDLIQLTMESFGGGKIQ